MSVSKIILNLPLRVIQAESVNIELVRKKRISVGGTARFRNGRKVSFKKDEYHRDVKFSEDLILTLHNMTLVNIAERVSEKGNYCQLLFVSKPHPDKILKYQRLLFEVDIQRIYDLAENCLWGSLKKYQNKRELTLVFSFNKPPAAKTSYPVVNALGHVGPVLYSYRPL